jgi:hypothetical protein
MDLLADKDAICLEKFTDQLYQWQSRGSVFVPDKLLTAMECMEPLVKNALQKDGHAAIMQ